MGKINLKNIGKIGFLRALPSILAAIPIWGWIILGILLAIIIIFFSYIIIKIFQFIFNPYVFAIIVIILIYIIYKKINKK